MTTNYQRYASPIAAEYAHLIESGTVRNFMGGTSFTINPVDTFKIVAASSIFGEPSYYRGSDKATPRATGRHNHWLQSAKPDIKTDEMFENALDKALDHDFMATLKVIQNLRHRYNMRLNPSVGIVRAAMHPKRSQFNIDNPSVFKAAAISVARRPDDITNQFEYWMKKNGSKNKLPNILKRSWAKRLAMYDRYQIAKYQSKGLRDLVRISHAKGEMIDELMRTQGSIPMDENQSTWERLRSQGKGWVDVFNTIDMPHMALLRNLRNLYQDSAMNTLTSDRVLAALKNGVVRGRQFPFRYYTAYGIMKGESTSFKADILKALNESIDIAMANFPQLKGRTVALSDNSGSAWGTMTTDFGSTTVADIGNLSSIMLAKSSENGRVGVFGDRLMLYDVDSNDGVLTQKARMDELGKDVGQGTEHGIWLFFDGALKRQEHYDNIFIFSDMQAGYGQLYGFGGDQYKEFIARHQGTTRTEYIDVLKLVMKYREEVNPKVNLFSVQTAGYDNSILPDQMYRGALLTGWTGKEAVYADSLIRIWDDIESRDSLAA